MDEIQQMFANMEKGREKHDRFMEDTNRIILTATPSQIRRVQKVGIVTPEKRIVAIQKAMDTKARAAQVLASGKTDYAQVLFRKARQEVRIANMFVTRG